ncbi:uncharacterized protein LOC143464722 isoform X2 [Clavelina lepadiformis]|uniref:uncharacterized protein LOC143464722 isoform X2 n=1 Tax=Clavelina lepadiformis TaxID=159417 RepID=UPI004042D485
MKTNTVIKGLISTSDSESPRYTSVTSTSFTIPPLQSEVKNLKQQLETKEMELSDLANRHQKAVSDRESMEGQLKVMKEKVQETDNKLSEIKAESEAAIRQNERDQQELAMIRRRSLVGGGGQIITQMYETILMRYERLNTSHEELRRKMNDESEKRVRLQKQLDAARLRDSGVERESLLRQLNSMTENVYRLERDLSRVREERTMIKREYSLVMSERDAVHREMDKLQDDLIQKQKEIDKFTVEKAQLLEEKEKLNNQIINLQQGSTTSLDVISMQQELYAAQRERKQALLDKEEKVHEAYNAHKAHTIAKQTIEKISRERDIFKSNVESLKQQLSDAVKEAKDATRWRERAFSEREQLRLELEESRKACDLMAKEREKLVKQLEESVKEHDTTKETKNKILGELRKLQQRENTHSHDSAIDAGEWDSDMNDNAIKKLCIVKVSARPHEITIEKGFYIKYSSVPGIFSGERIMALNDNSLNDKSLFDVQDILNHTDTCLLQLVRQSAGYESVSNQDVIIDNLLHDYSSNPEHRNVPEMWNGAEVNLRKRVKNEQQAYNDLSPVFTKQIDVINAMKIGNRNSAVLHSEAGSPVSNCTASSDPSHTPHNKENVFCPGESASLPSGKRKKPKMTSSRFLFRKKKSRSVVGTSSTGGSNGGTWPRLDSPSLNNLISNGGRLSVFVKRKHRPLITSNTFTPPGGHSAGHTPPTALRGPQNMSPASPNTLHNSMSSSYSHSSQSGSVTQSSQSTKKLQTVTRTKLHKSGRRERPNSAPMDDCILIPWQPHSVNNNNTTTSLVNSSVQDNNKGNVRQMYLAGHSQNNATNTSTDICQPKSPSVTTSSDLLSLPYSARSPYLRQKSVPDWSHGSKLSSTLPSTLPNTSLSSSLNASSSSSVALTSRARNANSLPRPSSARPTFSVPPYSSNTETRKSRTLECRRIRLPSEVSVGIRISGPDRGSVSLGSDRSTPVLSQTSHSPDPVETTSRSASQTDASVSSLSVASTVSSRSKKPPVSNDPRYVTMVKGPEPIGISIVSGGESGGIFVSRLTERSIAAKAGLEYGDQLLEYNGVNLRNAKEEQARVIISQTQPGDNIKLLAQYNLEKYKQSIESNLSDTLGIAHPISTPIVNEEKEERTITPDATPRASPHVEETLRSQRMTEPRYVFLSEGCNHIKLAGGNSFGIYVASVQSNEDTLTPNGSDLRIGDKILEFNSVMFDNTTLEGASLLLSRGVASCSMRVIYEPNKFKQIYGLPGDHFFVRALFDHPVDKEGALRFDRNSILLIENTYPDYVTGQWIAWLVDEQGLKSTKGRIPSKVTVEKDRENSSHPLDDVTSFTELNSGKRLSGSGRRSFFKRKKPHRTSSRSSGDVRLPKSLSETSIETVADVSSEHLGAYQVVEKHSSDTRRPVIIFGPHSSLVVERLTREHTQQFVKCCLVPVTNVGSTIQGSVVDTYTQNAENLALTGDELKKTMAQHPDRHVLLELSIDAVDRLHSMKFYPIILFIKYTSAKKVKESQDKTPGREKITMKRCKEILERTNSIERRLMSKYYGTVTINGGTASIVASKVSKVVSHEHNKVLWLPAKSELLNY